MSIEKGLKYIVYGALFIIPFIPLYVANSLFFPFITGKGFLFRILVEIALFAWIPLALANKDYRPKFSWILVVYTAFVAWLFIANMFAINPHKAFWSNFERMDGWVTMVHVFLFFIVSGAVLSADKLWRKWWLTFLSASALMCVYALFQLAGAFEIHQGGVRVDGTVGNAAYLAAYLLFATAIAVWQAFESKGWLRHALFVLAALQAFIVFESATRGAVLGLIAGALVAALLWMVESGGKSRKIAGAAIAIIVVVAGGVYAIRDTQFVKNEQTLARVTSISLQDLSVRTQLWGMAVSGVSERPLTGYGQEGFNYIFNEHYKPSLYAQEPWFDRAHNVYVDWLVAGGIPALLLFLSLFVMTAIALYRREASRPERILLIAALVAYGVQAIVVFDNLLTYIPLAAILATAHATSSRRIASVQRVEQMKEQTLQTAVPLITVIAIALIWFVNVPNIQAASKLVKGLSYGGGDIKPHLELLRDAADENTYATQEVREQMVLFLPRIIGSGRVPQEVVQFAQFTLTEMGKEVERQPKDARIRLEYALGLRVIGEYEMALEQIAIAHELSPKKQQILIEQGIEFWQINQFDKARDSFRKAYELDTSFDEVAIYAAAGEIAAGNLAEGKGLLTEKLGTTTPNNDLLVLAYYTAKDFDSLIKTVQAQVQAENGSVNSRMRLATAYAAAGQFGKARQELAVLVKEHPEASAQAAQLSAQFPK